jgi:hypothetical protein
MRCVFLVHGLLAHFERVRDLLPRPTLPAGVADLERFESLGQPSQRERGPQAGPCIGATGGDGEFVDLTHGVKVN